MNERRPLPAIHRLAPRIFYGWIVVAGASLLSFVSVGVGFYGIAVFLDALCSTHGWSKSSVSGATSLYFIVSGIAGTLVGRSVDRRGARGWIAAGGVTMAAALIALGSVQTHFELYLVYILLALGFAMCGAVPSNALITSWFVGLRGRAMSFSQTGVSVGGVLLVPLSMALIESRGLFAAALTLAVLVLVVNLPISLFVVRSDPRPHGLEPYGATGVGLNPLLAPERQLHPWTTRAALATSAFWRLAGGFSLVMFAQQAVLMHQISFLRERMDASSAALALSTTAAGSIVARLAVGAVADRIQKRRLVLGLVLFQSAVLIVFSVVESPVALFAAALCLGFTVGNLFMMQSLLTSELFGFISFGKVFGSLQLITQVSGGLGPLALGLLYEGLGGYEVSLRLLAGLELIGFAILFAVRAPEIKPGKRV